MCGIAGIVGLGGAPVDMAVLGRMNVAQSHRGPDGEGFMAASAGSGRYEHTFMRRAAGWPPRSPARVALGHRRLAIIDLSERGLQPMASPDRATWVVFNGEIYNFRALRADLRAVGHEFETLTDTEVLLRAYEHWGEDCLGRLEGMFAFAVWDGRRGRLFCARDRLGIKPFYYAAPRGSFVFASEIKALLEVPGVEAEADDDAALGFLVHGNCDVEDRTILRGVRALPAGHALTLDPEVGRPEVRPYWRLEPAAERGAADAERIGGLRSLLLDATRKHLISDVRAGSCLSGGLDSSAVVGLIGRVRNEQPEAAAAVGDRLHTFTSCYEHAELDERRYALASAASVSASPELVFPSPEDFWADFGRMAWHLDMPFGGLSYYAQWRVMRAAREAGVKVLLDGQGGDEVFGGYAKFRYARMASLLRSGRVVGMAREAAATIGQGDRSVLDLRRGYRYLPRGLRRLFGVDSLLRETLRADWGRVLGAASNPSTRWWRNASGHGGGDRAWSTIQRIQADDIRIDTLPQLLRMEDRSSMAFSLEARVPLLDHRLVEYGLSLPDHLKVSGGWNKFAIRQAMRGIVPEAVRLRKSKLGFAAPDRLWLARDLKRHVLALISEDLRCGKYVDAAALRRWYGSARAQRANTESYLGLFRALSLEMWMRAYGVS